MKLLLLILVALFPAGVFAQGSGAAIRNMQSLGTNTTLVNPTNIAAGATVSPAELATLDGIVTASNLQAQINGKLATLGTVWGGISNPATGGTNVLITNAKTTIQNGSANTLVLTNAKVGIGGIIPGSALSVNGGVGIGPTYGDQMSISDGLIVEGSVGIGLTTPGAKLHVLTDANNYALRTGDGVVTTSIFNGANYGWFGTESAHPLALFSGGSSPTFFITSGNVGIGTATPTSGKLVVAGSITADTDDTGGIGAVGANRFNNIQIGTGASAFAGGIASARSNLLAAATITVTASPFNWTNTANVNVTVYIDGISVTGTVGINGGIVFNSIGQNTIILQPNGWTTITYTLGTPTATWKPF